MHVNEMYVPDEVDLELLNILESTPGELLTRHGAPEPGDATQAMENALMSSSNIQNANGDAPTTVEGEAVISEPGTPGANIPPPQPTQQGNMARYGSATQPVPDGKIRFKLSELIDPELAVMILDMLLSWGAEFALDKVADIPVKREDIRADEHQKQTLIKAFRPAFDNFEVSTKNPLVAMALACTAVYGMNVMDAIRKVKKEKEDAEAAGKEYLPERKRKEAKYSKTSGGAPKKTRDYKAENERRKAKQQQGSGGVNSMPPNPANFT